MTKTCLLTLHFRDEKQHSASQVYPLKIEESENKDNIVPDALRNSLTDSVKFMEVHNWLSLQILLNNTPTLEDHLHTLQFLRYSFAFRAYQFFNIEYAEIIRLYLMEKNQTADNEPSASDIFNMMVAHNLFAHQSSEAKKNFQNELMQQLKARPGGDSYSEKYINEEPYSTYFKKLGVSQSTNTFAPEDYLTQNFFSSMESESLLHVRECEDIGCSINPNKSPFTKFISDCARKKIVENVLEHNNDRQEPFLYCGFASGFWRRDLDIIKELILTVKISNMQLCFIDKSYENFINAATDTVKPGMENYVDVTFIYKAIKEFSSWVTTHLNAEEDNPLTIHLFSDVEDAIAYFKSTRQKITLLVGQDYFTDGGCHSARYATPGAHDDFMRLARNCLAKDGRFFEAIKNDLKDEIYFHEGKIHKKDYFPACTKQWNMQKKESRVYERTSLAFFTPCEKDQPTDCAEGADCIERQYNENAALLSMKKYSTNH